MITFTKKQFRDLQISIERQNEMLYDVSFLDNDAELLGKLTYSLGTHHVSDNDCQLNEVQLQHIHQKIYESHKDENISDIEVY